jgi:ribosomal protein S19
MWITKNKINTKQYFIDYIKKVKRINLTNFEKLINKTIIHKRKEIISPQQLGKEVSVWNGKKYIPIKITTGKINRHYSDFCFTKRMGKAIHTSDKKRDKKKKTKGKK